MDKNWKRMERKVAGDLGGKRVIEKGYNLEDVSHPIFSIECKTRKKLPASLESWYNQAKTNAPKGKIPVVVLHETGKRRKNDFVVLKYEDFRDLCGDL